MTGNVWAELPRKLRLFSTYFFYFDARLQALALCGIAAGIGPAEDEVPSEEAEPLERKV